MRRRDVIAGMAGVGLLGACEGIKPPVATNASGAALDAAFLYGFPLYETCRLGQQAKALGGADNPGLNRIAHAATLVDHTMREVTAPNNDTVYSTANLELSNGPVEIFSPTDTSRYFSIAFMNAFTDNFAYIGTRATKGQGGRFWVAGPQWRGSAPAGVTVFNSSTNDVWMAVRVLVDGPDDLAAARALQTQVTVKSTSTKPPRPFAFKPVTLGDPAEFLGVVSDMIARSPGGQGQLARAPRFADQGIGRTASPELIETWRAFLPETTAKLAARRASIADVVNGWSFLKPGLGNFGENDAYRAIIALSGVGGLEDIEAMYIRAIADAAGAPLTGQKKYVWRVPPGGVPAEAFWSLTMYQREPDGRLFLIDNPIRRYSIGNRTRGLVKNADGSMDILIQREPPTGPLAANWLPAPAGPMVATLRAYLPKPELRDRTWKPAPFTAV